MVQPDCGEAPLAAHRGPGFQLPGDVIAMLAFQFTSAVDGIVREPVAVPAPALAVTETGCLSLAQPIN